MLGLTRVNGAFYSFLAECEALTGEKWRQFAGENQVSGGGLAVVVTGHSRGPGEIALFGPIMFAYWCQIGLFAASSLSCATQYRYTAHSLRQPLPQLVVGLAIS